MTKFDVERPVFSLKLFLKVEEENAAIMFSDRGTSLQKKICFCS